MYLSIGQVSEPAATLSVRVSYMRMSVQLAVLAAGLAALISFGIGNGSADSAGVPELSDRSSEWQLARGGRIYDNWFAARLIEAPYTLHPMLPARSEIEPSTSWRCSTCHGWDYLGGEIIGSDVPSLEELRGGEANAIERLLRAKPHGYTAAILPDQELGLVARFVVEGQHRTADYFDPVSGEAVGRAFEGRPIYQGVCISCHDADGRAYIEGEPGDEVSLGWLSRNRTAQVLHKIRNGQPGTDMVQLRFLTDAQIADLLSYLQTLPDP